MALTPNPLLSPPLRRLAAGGAMAATVLAVAACGSTGDGTSASSSSGTAAAGGPTVVAKNFSFSPTNVPVTAGQVSVTFDNQDSTEHSLTLDNGSGETEAAGGKQATLTFTAPASGSLTFHCKYHPQMKGSFTAGGGSGASSGSGSGSSSSSSSYGY
jgi:plastocyanin